MSRHLIHRNDNNKLDRLRDIKDLGMGYLDLNATYDGLVFDRGNIYIVDFKNPETKYGRDGWNENQQKKNRELSKHGIFPKKILTLQDVVRLKNS